jgi:hypothetical protein
MEVVMDANRRRTGTGPEARLCLLSGFSARARAAYQTLLLRSEPVSSSGREMLPRLHKDDE